jgi:uncharacterized protein (UPF0332 family)
VATWEELSLECLSVAKILLVRGHFRGSINRSYYAAYCALTNVLIERKVRFARGWNNPAHEQLTPLISSSLSLPQEARRRLRKRIFLLRHAREDADYRPGISIDRRLALNCIRDAIAVLNDLGVSDEPRE